MSFNRLTPEQIVNQKFTDARVEALALLQSFRFFYYRVYFYANNETLPEYSTLEEDMLQFFQDTADLTFKQEDTNIKWLVQNVPQGAGKTTKIEYFVTWCMLREPRSNFLLIGATADTSKPIIKHISSLLFRPSKDMPLTYIQELFDIRAFENNETVIRVSSNKDSVIRCVGVEVDYSGASASVVGINHFAGCAICDDITKTSDGSTHIENVSRKLMNSLGGRVRNIACSYYMSIMQRIDANDLPGLVKKHHYDNARFFIRQQHTRFNTTALKRMYTKEDLVTVKKKAYEGVDVEKYFYHLQQMDRVPIVTHTVEDMIARAEITRPSFIKRIQEHKVIGKLYSIDPSALTRGSDPTGVGEFVILERDISGRIFYEYHLINMYLFKYETFAKIDTKERGLREPKPNYQSDFKLELEEILKNDLYNGNVVYVIIESTPTGKTLSTNLQYQLSGYNDIEIIEETPDRFSNAEDRKIRKESVKYTRFLEAITWQNSDASMPKLYIVSKDTTEPKASYPYIAENVEKMRKVDILKEQIRTVNSRKTHDEMIDCISQALLWAKKREEKAMQEQYTQEPGGFMPIEVLDDNDFS